MNEAPPRQGTASKHWREHIRAALAFLMLYGALAQILLSGTMANAQSLTIVAFGDSLTAGYGLAPDQSFPHQLEAALRARGHAVTVVNAGVSGDTTAAGLARFDWAVGKEADAVILELGANDALRGLKPEEARANLDAILTKLKAKGVPVLVAGMLAPRNLGAVYGKRFDSIFPDLAEKHDALLYPFFLEGVAGDQSLNLPDGLHPNQRGIGVIVKNILPSVEKLIERARSAEPKKASGAGQ